MSDYLAMNPNRSGRSTSRKSPSRKRGTSAAPAAQNLIGNISLRQRPGASAVEQSPDPNLMLGVREALSGTLATADMSKGDSDALLGFPSFGSTDLSNSRSFLCQQQRPAIGQVASVPMPAYASIQRKTESLGAPKTASKTRAFLPTMPESSNLNSGQVGQLNGNPLNAAPGEADDSFRFLTFLDLMGKNADPPPEMGSDRDSYTGETGGGPGDFTNYFSDHTFVPGEAAATATAKPGAQNSSLQTADNFYKHSHSFGQTAPATSDFQQSLPFRLNENGPKGSQNQPSSSEKLVSSLQGGIDSAVFVTAQAKFDEVAGKYGPQLGEFKPDFPKSLGGERNGMSLSNLEHSQPRLIDQDSGMLEVSTPVTDRSSPGCGSPVPFDSDENMFATFSIVGPEDTVIEMKAIDKKSNSLDSIALAEPVRLGMGKYAPAQRRPAVARAENNLSSTAGAVKDATEGYSPLKETFASLSPDMQARANALKSKIKAMPRRKLRESLARDVKLVEVEPLMVVNRDDLAGFLGLGVTTWKSFVHSELGVARWPARALKPISNKALEHETRLRIAIETRSSDEIKRLRCGLEKLEEERRKIMAEIRMEATKTSVVPFSVNILGKRTPAGGAAPQTTDGRRQQKRVRLSY